MHAFVWFVTLTYSDEHLGDGSLRYEHVRKFFRELRRIFPGLRFAVVGHYGGQTLRCHWHAVIFGPPLFDTPHQRFGSPDDPQYTFDVLAKCWPYGHHRAAIFTPSRGSYVANYAVAAKEGRKPHPFARGEFFRASRNPGLGSKWLERFGESDAYAHGFVVKEGQKLPIPKFYLNRLRESDPDRYEEVKAARMKRAGDRQWDGSSDRLAVRSEVADAKARRKKRTL